MNYAQRSPLQLAGLILLCGFMLAGAAGRNQLPSSKSPQAEDREKQLALGKKIFVERCASCHDERGDKALNSGPPLAERDLSDADIARLASGRLKNAPEEEKRAVALYISSFMKRK